MLVTPFPVTIRRFNQRLVHSTRASDTKVSVRETTVCSPVMMSPCSTMVASP